MKAHFLCCTMVLFAIAVQAQIILPDSLTRRDTVRNKLGYNNIFTFDTLNTLRSFKDANGNLTTYRYDKDNQLVEERFADGSRQKFEYTPQGALRRRVTPKGQTIHYVFDSYNQLVKRDYPGANDDIFIFDTTGLIVQAYNRDVTIKYTYDDKRRILSEEINGHTTAYQYNDSLGRKTVVYPSGRTLHIYSDSLNKPLKIEEGEEVLAQFVYGKDGRVSQASYQNQTNSTYQYDKNGNILQLNHHPEIASFSYGYDKKNRLLFEAPSPNEEDARQYVYNRAGQIIDYREGAIDKGIIEYANREIRISYDPAGNRDTVYEGATQKVYSTTPLNAYSQVNQNKTTFFEYDSYGNLNSDGQWHYTYDIENRLTEMTNPSLGNYINASIYYKYDPFGRRIEKIIGNRRIQYFYMGDKVIEEQDYYDKTLATYVYLGDKPQVINMQKGGKNYFYHHNSQGSVIALTNEEGEVEGRYLYDLNGEATELTADYRLQDEGKGLSNPYRFAGNRWDAESDMYLIHGRYYRTDWGRAINRAHIGYGLGVSAYPIKTPLFYEDMPQEPYEMKVVGCGSLEEVVLPRWANLASKGNGHPFSNGQELLKIWEDQSDCGCIESLTVISHGWGWPQTRGFLVNGGVYGRLWTNGFLGDIPPGRKGKDFRVSKKARDLSHLQKAMATGEIEFCQPCEIVLTGCRVASTGNFVYRLARLTGCNVISSHGGCTGIEEPYFSSGPKSLKEKLSGEYRGFSRTFPDGIRIEIGDLIRLW